jgi:hypothetical protein
MTLGRFPIRIALKSEYYAEFKEYPAIFTVNGIVPHGGYTDSALQYLIGENTYVPSDNAIVVTDVQDILVNLGELHEQLEKLQKEKSMPDNTYAELVKRLKRPVEMRGTTSEDAYAVYNPLHIEAAEAIEKLSSSCGHCGELEKAHEKIHELTDLLHQTLGYVVNDTLKAKIAGHIPPQMRVNK